MEFMSKERFEEEEKKEKFRTKVLKFIAYKKRTEDEVRQKFQDEDQDLLDDTIDYLKDLKYIDDEAYVEKSILEYMKLKNLSIKEVSYKLIQKGINKRLIDDYICKNKENMLEFEIASAKNIIIKRQGKSELEETKQYLFRKGYMSESINIAIDEINEE